MSGNSAQVALICRCIAVPGLLVYLVAAVVGIIWIVRKKLEAKRAVEVELGEAAPGVCT